MSWEDKESAEKRARKLWFGPEPSRWEFNPKQRICRVVDNHVTFDREAGEVHILQTLKCGAVVSCKTAGKLPGRRQCADCTAKGIPDARTRYEEAVERWRRRGA